MNEEQKPEESKPPVSNNSMKFSTEEVFPVLQSRFGSSVLSLSDTKPDKFILVDANSLPEICTFLRDDPAWRMNMLHCVSGLDEGDTLAVVYHLFSMEKRHFIVLKTQVSKEDATVPSLAGIWPAADWLERETYDLLGIRFRGHPDLRRILLPEEWVGHPLRKDNEMPEHEELLEQGF